MAKPDDKEIKVNRSNKSNSSTVQKENIPKRDDDAISISKQLMMKKKTSRTSRKRSKEPRVCANGKPIPSLADLEKMFEDSDEEPALSTQSTSNINVIERPNTPKPQAPTLPDNKLLSPSTIDKISERMLEMISNINDPTELLEVPRPPVVPPKKRKKPDQPYIVGCKDRPQVIKQSNANFCKGDQNYGIDHDGVNDEDEPPSKRGKKSKIPKYSKSIFNAKSDEIAERLQNNGADGNESLDSDKNIGHEFMTSYNVATERIGSFSPLPSSSRDDETIKKNDELFNQSLNNINNRSKTTATKNSDIEIITVPCETIVIDDEVEEVTLPRNKVNKTYKEINDVEIVEATELISPNFINKNVNENYSSVVDNNKKENKKTDENNDIFIIEDIYSDVQFTVPNNSPLHNENEIIDVDQLIAQNLLIIEKYKRDSISTVINVDTPSTSTKCTVYDNNKRTQEQLITQRQNTGNLNNNGTPQPGCSDNISPRKKQKKNDIEKVVTNFFKNRSRSIDHRKEIIDVDGETVIKSLNPHAIETVSAFINSVSKNLIPNQTPNSATDNTLTTCNVAEHSPGKRHAPSIPTYNSVESPSSSNKKSLGDCPICLDSLNNHVIASTICGHVFCLKCIQAAIKSNGKRCPTCRKYLKGGKGFHNLYL